VQCEVHTGGDCTQDHEHSDSIQVLEVRAQSTESDWILLHKLSSAMAHGLSGGIDRDCKELKTTPINGLLTTHVIVLHVIDNASKYAGKIFVDSIFKRPLCRGECAC
jgi:hypothetical protein